MDHVCVCACVSTCSFVDIKKKISSLNSISHAFSCDASFKVYIFCGIWKGVTLSSVILFFSQEPVNLPQSECVCFSVLSKDGEAECFFVFFKSCPVLGLKGKHEEIVGIAGFLTTACQYHWELLPALSLSLAYISDTHAAIELWDCAMIIPNGRWFVMAGVLTFL